MGHTKQIEQLRREYLADSGEKMGNLRELLDAWSQAPDDLDAFHSFERVIHNLSGSGASYGHPRISEAARAYEALLIWIQRQQVKLNPERLALMRDAIDEMEAVIAGERDGVSVEISSCKVLAIFKKGSK